MAETAPPAGRGAGPGAPGAIGPEAIGSDGRIAVAGHRLEAVWHGPSPQEAPTLVFLHEGLGSVGLWRDVPAELARRTGCGALVYSRAGYGGSSPCALPRPLAYMHDEARIVLPALLAATGVRRHVLVGHSDGASIALVHAGANPAAGLAGLALEAPHVFTESFGVESIRAANRAYAEGDLRARLERHHGDNVDTAFRGWADAWLDPGFLDWNIEEFLPAIAVPMLLIQGENDEYGTLAQLDAIERGARAADCRRQVLRDCGHSPHRDQPERTLSAIAAFVAGVLG